MVQFNFKAIGTTWRIDISEKMFEAAETELFSVIQARIDLFDKAYSRFREDSLVTKMSKESGIFELPEDAELMMSLYHDLYTLTGGLFTPMVGNILSDAGYDAGYSLHQKKELDVAPVWDEVMSYEHLSLTIKKPILLDFGAAGKGYLVDIIGELLEKKGIHEFYIDASGDILHKGQKGPIRVGLEDPENAKRVVGVCELANASICGSAGNRRAWANFTHIINPLTLSSPTDIAAVWVVAETALVADALATCLFFVPAATLTDAYSFEYLIIKSDRSIEKSPGFKGELFLV